MGKIVIVYSGGLDSSVLLAETKEGIHDVIALNFNYGSKHNIRERHSAKQICSLFNIPFIEIELPFINELFKSDLLQSGGVIPEGKYESDNMSKTVVPYRNGIMLSIAAGYAESIGAAIIMIANHGGDHNLYSDCCPDFIESQSKAICHGTSSKIMLWAPYTRLQKHEIITRGVYFDTPLALTYSCYKGGEKHCGTCGTCVERHASFKLAGVEDFTEYEEKK